MFSLLKEGLTAAVKTSHEYIFTTHLCHAFFTDINIVSKVKVCVKNTFFKHIILRREEKIEKYKNNIHFHCPFSRKTMIKSKQIHFCG
jgi:hypothetical protein